MKTYAHANIALIKYWGKRDTKLFLPTKSSISVTLQELTTETVISSAKQNTISISGNTAPIVQFLQLFRTLYNKTNPLHISSTNSFPTAAGLASSASGFAALALGLSKFYSLNLSPKELSILARQGSGSACRSIHGGFVTWHKGENPDGSDSYAEQLFDQNHWPEFRLIVCIVNDSTKAISSRSGMQQTVATSPFYAQWLKNSEQRIPHMINALALKDISSVGHLAEQDCLEMHHCMHTTIPAINYWQPETESLMALVSQLRQQGIPAYFTIDAGPNVKIITTQPYVDAMVQKLHKTALCQNIITCHVGGPAA